MKGKKCPEDLEGTWLYIRTKPKLIWNQGKIGLCMHLANLALIVHKITFTLNLIELNNLLLSNRFMINASVVN